MLEQFIPSKFDAWVEISVLIFILVVGGAAMLFVNVYLDDDLKFRKKKQARLFPTAACLSAEKILVADVDPGVPPQRMTAQCCVPHTKSLLEKSKSHKCEREVRLEPAQPRSEAR
jgi:hypothetical protein